MVKQGKLHLSASEKSNARILIVDADDRDRSALRSLLTQLSFERVTETADLFSAAKKLEERRFSHLLFMIPPDEESGREFLLHALHADPEMACISMSSAPDVDQLFGMLSDGVHGYLLKPFDKANLEETLALATHGERIPPELLRSDNRGQVLISCIAYELDKAAQTVKDSMQRGTPCKDLAQVTCALSHAVHRALACTKGGKAGFLEDLENYFIQRSSGPATRLGRLRKRLAALRSQSCGK